jgi:hypothetical protein
MNTLCLPIIPNFAETALIRSLFGNDAVELRNVFKDSRMPRQLLNGPRRISPIAGTDTFTQIKRRQRILRAWLACRVHLFKFYDSRD